MNFRKAIGRINFLAQENDDRASVSRREPFTREQLERGLQAAEDYLVALKEKLPSITDDVRRQEYAREIATMEGIISGLAKRLRSSENRAK